MTSSLAKWGVPDVKGLCDRFEEALGGRYRVTSDPQCLTAHEDDRHGGRSDDARRARDLQRALRDDRVHAVVAVAGGAWFTRILRRIDFGVLRRRRTRLWVLGMSEMTPLINIAACHRQAVGIYDAVVKLVLDRVRSPRAAKAQLEVLLEDMGRMIAGEETFRSLRGTWISGKRPDRSPVRIVGGNLTLIAAMMGGPYARAFDTRAGWLAVEDVNEKPERIDRMLAQLRLAGLFDRIEGVLLGDFHRDRDDLHDAVVELLRFHLPSRRIPVVGRCNFGHVWPVAPLPIRRPLRLWRQGDVVHLTWDDPL